MNNLERDITKEIINQADKKAVGIVIKGITPEDGTIACSLYDTEDNMIASGRIYAYKGGYKNIPIDDLADDEIEYLNHQKPTNKWSEKLIKMWLSDRQQTEFWRTKGVADPFYFSDEDTKADLLERFYLD